MLCPRCIQDIDEGAKSCPHCGAIATDEGASQPVPQDPEVVVIGAGEAAPAPQPAEDPPVPVHVPGAIIPVDPGAPAPSEPARGFPGAAAFLALDPKKKAQLKLAAGLLAAFAGVILFTDMGFYLRLSLGLAKPPAAAPGPAEAPVSAPPQTPAAPAPAPVARTEPAAAEDPSSEPAADARAPGEEGPAEPAPLPSATWVFEGRVYDMITLKPVKGAQLAFMGGETEAVFTTDARGVYRASVPALEGGYSLVVDHPDYLEGHFDETSPPYRQRKLAQRHGMRTAEPSGEPWVGDARTPLKKDLVLFPAVTD